jgi:hypothetical protein
MQRKRIKGAIWCGVVAIALSISLLEGKEAQANVNTVTKPQNLLEGSQMPATRQTKQNSLDRLPMLISQADGLYDGRWIGTIALIRDPCGFYSRFPQLFPVDLTVIRTSDVDGEVRYGGYPTVYKGKVNNGGVQASARGASGVYTYFILNRIGNSATVALVFNSDIGCDYIYQGEATIQGP